MGVRSVCVIGGGAAGLCAARHLKEAFSVTVFELTQSVGGTWVYTDQVGRDALGNAIHSSMYKGLRTNLPRELMAFPDFPFTSPPLAASFVTHADVLEYLQAYTEHFELTSLIRFRHKVLSVTPIDDQEGKRRLSKWRVVVEDESSEKVASFRISDHVFDAVIVCNGHHSHPKWAEVIELERFEGEVMHSHDYRMPTHQFANKNVLVLGANPSGSDIGLEIARVATKVYVGHSKAKFLGGQLPCNVHEVAFAHRCLGGKNVELIDGQVLEVDVIVFCTGYYYTFPFLSPECDVQVEKNVVGPLYKHLFNVSRPNLVFVGLLFRFIPFLCFDLQMKWVARFLEGRATLPSVEQMLEDTQTEKEMKARMGWKEHHFHQLGPLMENYFDHLAKEGHSQPMTEVVRKMFRKSEERRSEDVVNYKRDKYIVKNNQEFDFHKNFFNF